MMVYLPDKSLGERYQVASRYFIDPVRQAGFEYLSPELIEQVPGYPKPSHRKEKRPLAASSSRGNEKPVYECYRAYDRLCGEFSSVYAPIFEIVILGETGNTAAGEIRIWGPTVRFVVLPETTLIPCGSGTFHALEHTVLWGDGEGGKGVTSQPLLSFLEEFVPLNRQEE